MFTGKMGNIVLLLLMISVLSTTEISTAQIYNDPYTPMVVTADTFISRWDTTLVGDLGTATDEIKLPIVYLGIYNFVVDWGDNTTDTITSYNQAEVTHKYATAGVYTVKMDGLITGIRIYYTYALKLIEISQWGNIKFDEQGGSFIGARNLVLTATDAPDLTGITDLSRTFDGCTNLGSGGNMNTWDVSSVTDMTVIFRDSSFNQDISNWDVSSVRSMAYMFYNTPFNQDISAWNVSSVINMQNMFYNSSFNQDISNWDVSSVISMYFMFYNSSFNQDISNWDVSSVTSMQSMFSGSSFNQNISNWDVSSVTSMHSMFYNSSFNQDIGNWDVLSVTSMNSMFAYSSFDQDIGNWNVSSVTDLEYMFTGNTLSVENYDSLLSGWSELPLQYGLRFYAGNSLYNNKTARQYIIDNFGWYISDNGYVALPEAPAIYTITEGNYGIIDLTWSEVVNLSYPVTEYRIYRSDDGDVFKLVGNSSTNSFSDRNINSGDYGYKVSAVNIAGESANSTVVHIEYVPFSIGRVDDISYEENSKGNELIWNVHNINNGSYSVMLNGSEYIAETAWQNEIVVSIDGLNPGVYELQLRVYSDVGDMVMDTVIITVTKVPNVSSDTSSQTSSQTSSVQSDNQSVSTLQFYMFIVSVFTYAMIRRRY